MASYDYLNHIEAIARCKELEEEKEKEKAQKIEAHKHIASLRGELDKAKRHITLCEKVIHNVDVLASIFNDGTEKTTGTYGYAGLAEEEDSECTGLWFPWAADELEYAQLMRRREAAEEKPDEMQVSSSHNINSTGTEPQTNTNIDTSVPVIEDDLSAENSEVEEQDTSETTVDSLADTNANEEPIEPVEDTNEWPWNDHPDPGSEPTPYDLYYGRMIADEDCIDWEPIMPDTLPDIPRDENVFTTNPSTAKPFPDSGGNVDWTTPRTACKNINFKAPPKIWYRKVDGVKLFRWATESRTRSRTLLPFQNLPDNVMFDRKNILDGPGPMWSCCSAAADHDRQIPIIDFARKACPLCRNSRHRGKNFPHDFRNTGKPKAWFVSQWLSQFSAVTLKKVKKMEV